MREIIIEEKGNRILICVLEENKICERYIYTDEIKKLIGNIYVGEIKDIIDGMQSAFVDIGVCKKAFVSIEDVLPKIDVAKENVDTLKKTKISKILKIGQHILVQVKKEPVDQKGARVSTHITIPGKYVVLMPNASILTISQKIELYEEKERLKNIVQKALPDGYGAIIRTDAEGTSDKNIEDDIEKVIELWKSIEVIGNETNKVQLIYDDNDVIKSVVREIVNKNTSNIYTNSKEIYEKIECKQKVKLFENENLIDKFGLTSEYEKVDDRKIWLKCGGQIVIDKTEALTAIDVNSSKCVGTKNLENTIYNVNKEAAVEVMRQIRLKDIGGIVIIDFIDMQIEEHKNKILEIMQKEAKKDRSKVDIKEFTKLNLVELTRKKMYL